MRMKLIFVLGISLLTHLGFSQTEIEWSPEVELTLSDYQSPSTEINEELSVYSIGTMANVAFSFSMSYYEFMFTKNFNGKVSNVFHGSSSYITAPNRELAEQLVNFGQLEFDLTELTARKFRKRLLESKGMFSNTQFFQPLYDEIIAEQSARHGELAKVTDMGRNVEVLVEERKRIRNEINALADYCKTCKPPKKRKR